MNDYNNAILEPGDYLVELRFRRPVEKKMLEGVLRRMGWDKVVFDEWSGPAIGAMPMGRRSASSAAAPSSASRPVISQFTASAAPRAMSPQAAAVLAPTPAAAPAKSFAQAAQRQAGSAVSMSAPRVNAPPPLSMLPSMKPGGNAGTAPDASASAAMASASPGGVPSDGSAPSDGGGGGGGGDGGGGGGDAAPADPGPAAPPPDAPTYMGPQDDGGGEPPPPPDAPQAQDAQAAPSSDVPVDDISQIILALKNLQPGPVPVEPLAGETPDVKALRVANIWRRWKEWGSPFSAAPGGNLDTTAESKVRVSGESESEDVRVRFVASLAAVLRIQDTDVIEWTFVRRLTVNPFDDLNLQIRAFDLRPTRTYEFRLLARDRTTPQKEDVKTALQNMGFAPMKIALIKRNIRLPNRPGTDLSLWYGVGQWLKVTSAITSDDPLFFEEMKEVRP
jgi:hypothetical protein